MHLGWFSPLPPVRTGIAGRSAETVVALGARGHRVDAFDERAAHDFPWKHRREPYDLVVYQFGNSSHHDYEWPYAFNYPGLVVLHDTHLHHARAALLLREKRAADYRAEFAWNHPGIPADAAELAVAGFDSRLYYDWPMTAALVASSRLTAVHGEGARDEIIHALTPRLGAGVRDRIVSIRLGEGVASPSDASARARATVRAAHGIADDAIVFGCYGGLSPEKRVPQILAAFRATLRSAPAARLLLAGAPAAHYDVAADIAAHGLQDRVTLTGYIETDADLTDHIAACDVSLNLRWPTTRETSGPWLRALAAGKPTIVTDLVHMGNVPSLDPRTWMMASDGRWSMTDDRWAMADAIGERQSAETSGGFHSGAADSVRDWRSDGSPARAPDTSTIDHRPSSFDHAVCVAIDILDEDHSLRLAMRRLAGDVALRAELGRAAQTWWAREHSLEVMVADYERVMAEAVARPAAIDRPSLPAHIRSTGDERLKTLLAPFRLESPLDGR